MNFSILWRNARAKDSEYDREIYTDLNFDQIIKDIETASGEESDSLWFQSLLYDREDIIYRQDVLNDLDISDTLFQGIEKFRNRINRVLEYEQRAERINNELSKAHWRVLALNEYFRSLEEVVSILDRKLHKAQGWIDFQMKCKEILSDDFVVSTTEIVYDVIKNIEEIKLSLRIEKDHIEILQEEPERDYLRSFFEKHQDIVGSQQTAEILLPGSLESSKLEILMIEYLKKKKKLQYDKLIQFAENFLYLYDDDIVKFCKEVTFYLSYLKYIQSMRKKGFCFATPTFCEDAFSVVGGYDLALAQVNYCQGKSIVTNDYHLDGIERFFVITGPNQGGKTTFARSIGQLVVFSLLGLYVPATRASLPIFKNVYTHFEREESLESGAGKLKEELQRIEKMLSIDVKDNFVIFNEFFTSAASYDALIMGKRILKLLIEENCFGVYVTHIGKLAMDHDSLVSMVALTEDNKWKDRTYKIERKQPEEAGYVDSIVNRYGLDYENITRRLHNV